MLLRISQLRSHRLARVAAAVLTIAVLAGLAGCDRSSSIFSPMQGGAAIQGRVRGGQQGVSGASVHLYAAGSAGPGVGAVDLLAPHVVTTDGGGFFSITGDYACPTVTTQVYLVAQGGDPGLGKNNPALLLMAALGNCGGLTSSTSVAVNEATTVAAVWALAQFMGAGGVIGSTPTNATGLENAFAVASNLADGGSGLAPGSALPSGAVTETAKLYTLADVLATCINSDGGSACSPLFAAATTAGGAPTNTVDAALNIVRNPGANVVAVFNAAPAQGPFQPMLSVAPNDWTMSITYGGCMPACGGLNLPGALAIDSGGNVVVANYFGAVVSKFSPTGVPASVMGFPGAGLNQSYGIAVDGSDNIWVTNAQSVTAANNHHSGSVSEFSSAGAELSGAGYTAGGIYYPLAAAADSNGTIWIADYESSAATLLANDGSAMSGGSGYGGSALPFPLAVAVDASHTAWFAAQLRVASVTPAGVVSSFTCCARPTGIAIDAMGNVWVTDSSASEVVEVASGWGVTAAGTVEHRVTLLGGNVEPRGIAVDGAGNVWAANYYGDSLVELAGATAAVVSPAQGFGLDAQLNEPYGLAVDASGNLWLSEAGNNTLTEIVGVAGPVKTPLLGPPVQP